MLCRQSPSPTIRSSFIEWTLKVSQTQGQVRWTNSVAQEPLQVPHLEREQHPCETWNLLPARYCLERKARHSGFWCGIAPFSKLEANIVKSKHLSVQNYVPANTLHLQAVVWTLMVVSPTRLQRCKGDQDWTSNLMAHVWVQLTAGPGRSKQSLAQLSQLCSRGTCHRIF